jgi:hypothetical protein
VIVYVIAMVAILAVAGGVVGLVLVGMEGRGRSRMPWVADKLTRAARHLNGEVEPPQSFSRVVERSRRTTESRQPDSEHEATPAGR